MIMIKKPNYYRQIIQTLESLHKTHPTYNIGRHISTATNESDLWGVTDKELLFSLKKYETSLEMDVIHDEKDIENIIKDGMNLGTIFLNDNEDEEEY
jgi:hypothetical protein